MPWYKKLHAKILIGMFLGFAFGLMSSMLGWNAFTDRWIAPWGSIFVNLLKLIAVPLVLSSLIIGVASLSDLKKLSRIGGKTLAIYFCTTFIAIVIGLTLVNVVQPGKWIPENVKNEILSSYQGDADSKAGLAVQSKDRGPLQPLVNMVPSNILQAAADNSEMLKIVFFAILFGIGILQVERKKAQPIIDFSQSIFDVMIRVVDMIMLTAPYGVFALIASTITKIAGNDIASVLHLIGSLSAYCILVIVGLAIHTFGVLPLALKLFSTMNIKTFFYGMGPVQLLAFSSSSSSATLPLTMERCEEKLGISEEVSSFVLPLGSTVNMDGTALYQSIAIVFIAQTLGFSLSLTAQLSIILALVLSSVGTAGVPGGSIVMSILILESIGVPAAGIGLILGVDRILDMCRTVTNVTGDAVVATIVASSEGQLRTPNLSEEGDGMVLRR
ncbi:MAG: dicarboxylate/amino acid:cation symporter [Bdellovibrionales bacterium]|nr:dicarboxylate/amino acid:cation symporter [Bdellovibrionales bacterium]